MNLRIRAIWVVSSLLARKIFAYLTVQNADSEDSDQTARMHMSEGTFSDVVAQQILQRHTDNDRDAFSA